MTPDKSYRMQSELQDGVEGYLPRIVGRISYAAKGAVGAYSWH
jgi:hypothetical protein